MQKNSLLLPLTLAYSLSACIRLVFPMPTTTQVSRLIDSIFDEVLNKLSLSSKGILYAKDLGTYENRELLEGAAFVMTTDTRVEQIALEKKLPYAFISQRGGKEAVVSLYYLENIKDEGLRRKLAEYIRFSSVPDENGFVLQPQARWIARRPKPVRLSENASGEAP